MDHLALRGVVLYVAVRAPYAEHFKHKADSRKGFLSRLDHLI